MKKLTQRQRGLIGLVNDPIPGKKGLIDWVAIHESHLGITTSLDYAERTNPALITVPAFKDTHAAKLIAAKAGVRGQGIPGRIGAAIDKLRHRLDRQRPNITFVFEEAEKLSWLETETLAITSLWCADQANVAIRLVFMFARKPVWNFHRRLYEPQFIGAFGEPGVPQCQAFRRLRLRATCWRLTPKTIEKIKDPQDFNPGETAKAEPRMAASA